MAHLRRLFLRLLNVVRPDRGESDLARELAAHLSMMEDALRRQGMSPEDARRDVAYALRTLGRAPGFTAVVVITLALGIGANAAIFSVVNGVLLQPLPFKDSDRLVRLYEHLPAAQSPNHRPRRVGGIDVRDLLELRARSRSLSDVVSYGPVIVTMTGAGGAVQPGQPSDNERWRSAWRSGPAGAD